MSDDVETHTDRHNIIHAYGVSTAWHPILDAIYK